MGRIWTGKEKDTNIPRRAKEHQQRQEVSRNNVYTNSLGNSGFGKVDNQRADTVKSLNITCRA